MKNNVTLIAFFCFVFVLASCNNTAPIMRTNPTETTVSKIAIVETQDNNLETTSKVTSTQTEPAKYLDSKDKSIEPVLLDTLKRNVQPTQASGGFDRVGIAVGETAVNFTLKDIDNHEFRLSQLLSEKPVVMIFASFT